MKKLTIVILLAVFSPFILLGFLSKMAFIAFYIGADVASALSDWTE